MADESKKDFNAETLLNEHGKDISGLSDRVGKCYSTEKYEDFQGAVEKIVSRYLKSVVVWGVLLWLISLIASMLAQKFLHVLGG